MSEDEPEAVEPDGQESGAQPPEARVPGARVPGVQPRGTGLSERDMAVLAFERRGWSAPGVKERAIREQLEMSPTRYYQLLNALLDDTHALAHDPVTVNRLRRRREAQRARR
jgi:Protein of unknown function (DUF3263)